MYDLIAQKEQLQKKNHQICFHNDMIEIISPLFSYSRCTVLSMLVIQALHLGNTHTHKQTHAHIWRQIDFQSSKP